ncbi:hypothetical protein ACHWQZ_G019262 [Mnemiopsis leidyi]
MFERVLETVLEKALGEFVQDINSEDLKLKVWSGNVVLKNLRLKAEALAKFDLPVFVYAGLIGSLQLQVPWKALWTAPTRVCVEDLVLLVVPKEAAPYNEEKARKEGRAKKKAMLQAVEEAQTRLSVDQEKEQKQTWAESLITAIIKNLEIKIKNIHIRYEDPDSGYAVGVTLDQLYATTTDEMWRPAVISNQSISRIFKLAKIENFCVYWNNPCQELFRLPQHTIEAELLKLIVSKETPNSKHNFVIHPMGCEVKMVIDPSNKVVADVPKASLSVHFSSLITEVRKTQYLDTMSLIDSMERGKKKQPFAKWHPGVPISGNAKKWWRYLHKYCVETRVKRKIIAWRWTSIKRHRQICREYTALRVKERVGKPTLNELARITEIFDELDIVNITICEQNAKLESDKIQAKASWFSGWWGGSNKSSSSVVDKFGMTSDEKDKLYSAIEQSQAAASDQIYPEKYVKFRLKLDVDKVSFKLNDNTRVITEAAVKGITVELGVIPYGNGAVLTYQIQTVYIVSDKMDILVPSDSHGIVPICEGRIVVNPTDSTADIVIFSKFSSVTLLFDINLINAIMDFTKTEKELTDFDELRKNIHYYSDRLKVQGKSGLLYAIEKRKIVDVNVTLSAPKVIIPESGKLEENGPLIVADLGRLVLTTEVGETRSPKELLAMSLAELEETAYDNYLLNLENFHVKMFCNKDDWENDLAMTLDSFILHPVRLNVNLSNSILPDDKKLPKIKCRGHLDSLRVVMSDVKIQNLYRILDSLPKTEPVIAEPKSKNSVVGLDDVWVDAEKLAAVTSIVTGKPSTPSVDKKSPMSQVSTSTDASEDFFDAPDHFLVEEDGLITETESLEVISQTIVLADFTLNVIVLDVLKQGRYEGKVVLKSLIKNITATFVKTTWMQKVEASLGEINVLDCSTSADPLHLVSSPSEGTLISIAAQMNDPTSPYFEADFKNTEMAIIGTFDQLAAKIHIDSFCNLYEFAMSLLPKSSEENTGAEEEADDSEEGGGGEMKKYQSVQSINENLIKIHAAAVVNNITIVIDSNQRTYADISITCCNAEVIMKENTTEVSSSLRSLDIKQPSSCITYNNILSVESNVYQELISFQMIQYKTKLGELDPDMEVKVKIGSLHFIFLNYFVQNLLHVLDIFSNVRDKMVSASIETAKLAQESSSSTLILLNCEVESPVVMIPRSSTSSEGYKVKLGNLKLQNKFSLTKKKTVKDVINIEISHIALSRVILGSYGDVLRERGILEPYEMELKISRYLSGSPDISVSTKLKEIHVNLGYEDYHMALKTLEENLGETGDRVIETTSSVQRDAGPADNTDHPSPGDGTSETTPRTGTSVTSDDRTITGGSSQGPGEIRIEVQIENAVCVLYTDEKLLDVADPESDKRQEDKIRMYSEVRNVHMELRLLGDGGKRVEMKMWDVRVEDTDTAVMESGVQRILAHKQLANEEAQIITSLNGTSSAIPARRAITLDLPTAMLIAVVEISESGDISVDSKINDTHVVVSWEFINNIITFFTVSPYTTESTGTTPVVITDSGGSREIEEIGQNTIEPAVPSQVTYQVTMTVNNPEVVFLSNHANWKTQALLLRTGVVLKFNQRGDQTAVQITVERITLFICQYLYRLSSIYLLLQPCDITMLYTKIEGEKESVDLNISDLVFNISPETLNVMMVVSRQFGESDTTNAAKKEHTAYAYNLWNMETIGEHNRWYLRQAAQSLIQENMKQLLGPESDIFSFKRMEPLGQTLILAMDSFKLTLEADYEPLVVITGHSTCKVKDWGGAMLVELDMSLEANYYSYTLGTFEPLLEQVEVSDGSYRMWNMSCTVKKCPIEISNEAAHLMQMFGFDGSSDIEADSMSQSSADSMDIMENAPPLYEIHITSDDKLLLTLTNSALKNFQVLSEAWSVVSDDMTIQPKAVSPLMVHNLCGVNIIVRGKQDSSRNVPPPEFELVHDEKQGLKLEMAGMKRGKDRGKQRVLAREKSQNTKNSEISDAASISVKIEGYEEIKDIQIVQAGLYIYGLIPAVKASTRRERNVLVEVTVVRSSKTVTIRSPLNFHNLQRVPVRLWYSAPDDTTNRELVSVTIKHFQVCTIEPGAKYSVPLDAQICGTGDSHHFHISPDIDGHSPSFPPLSANKLKVDKHQFVASYPASRGTELDPKHGSFSMQPLNVRNPTRLNLQNALYHTIYINPPVIICNKLPVTLRIQGAGTVGVSKDIPAGHREHFDLLDPSSDPCIILRIINYHDMGFDWAGEFVIDLKKFENHSQQFVTMTASVNNLTNRVTLGVLAKISDGLTLTVYSSYWMVNCTGRQLRYQGINDCSEILDPPSIQQPMMFSFLHTDKSKQKLRVKVERACWSEYFNIDTVGSSGSIKSFDEENDCYYEVGVTIALSNIQLTNIVTFYPRFQVINELNFPISVRGALTSELTECKCNKVTPFWPGCKDDHSLVIKIRKGKPTMAVPLGTTQQTVIRADASTDDACSFISIVVFVDVRTASTEIRIGAYYLGAAPVRIENLLSESSICFKQHSAMSFVTVPPNKSILYTWDFPDKKRELYWCVQGDEKNQKSANFIKDNCVGFVYHDLISQRQRKAQVVSFLDGLQRVLLFTDNLDVADCVGQEVIKIEQSHMLFEMSFPQSIGISLVDGIPQEVSYIQLDSSGAIWERKLRKRDRYKFLCTKISESLEEAFNADKAVVEFDDHKFDMTTREAMTLTYPEGSFVVVRRTYLPALWLQYTSSPSQTNVHFKVNRIQIDNQLTEHTFRHVFYPIKPPSHAIAQQPPKPLIEFAMIKQTTSVDGEHEQSVLDHYKYVKALVQEFHIKLDAGFLLSVMNFLKVDEDNIVDLEKQELEWLQEDLKLSRTALDDRDGGDEGGPPVFLDEFHLSPLKIHMSFSPDNNTDTTQVQVQEDTLALYLKSFGLGLVAINDSVLKLAYYDATGQLVTQAQLQDRVIKHYIHETLTQLYAVVFGLDILGNPYGLAQNIKEGTKDLFYEPYQGIVQGPREFAEGVVIGMNSFLRHSVGGIVGAASKISRSLGKGLAKLTFDEEYQKQRARRMAQKPAHIGEGLVRGGKSFLMGLYHGVTGVVVKPVEGAAQEGVEGFFKGVGKGLVGAVTRPLGGINDMITYTIDGIHHHTQIDEKIMVLRHPRYIQPDKIIRPYNTNQSEGKYLLGEVMRHNQWSDTYYHHSLLTTKSTFILTDQRCVLSEYDDVMNQWKVEWSHVYQDIDKLPTVMENEISIEFSAYMDPNVGISKFFKNRRKKTRLVTLPTSEETQMMLDRFAIQLRKTNKKRFAENAGDSCWDKCCRCL